MCLYPPPPVFVGGYTVFTLSVHPSVRPSVTFCFLNIFKSNQWNFIKPCIHIHIYRANNYNKSKDEGPFLWELFPFVILSGLCIYINRIFYITSRVIDRISPNLTHTFIFIWQVLIAITEGQGLILWELFPFVVVNGFCICIDSALRSYHSFWWSNLIPCIHNVDILNICMKDYDRQKIINDNYENLDKFSCGS